MAGVYDIDTHYQYEAGRGVQYLSTMERAMGGREGFAAQSPTAILSRAAPQSVGAARCCQCCVVHLTCREVGILGTCGRTA